MRSLIIIFFQRSSEILGAFSFLGVSLHKEVLVLYPRKQVHHVSTVAFHLDSWRSFPRKALACLRLVC